jgi:hypothetical protein
MKSEIIECLACGCPAHVAGTVVSAPPDSSVPFGAFSRLQGLGRRARRGTPFAIISYRVPYTPMRHDFFF